MKRVVDGQLSLAEALVGRRLGSNARLERIDGLVKWYRFEKLLSGLHASPVGRPSYPPLVMFKALLLQQWYGLSDAELEEALADRLSFRRFLGLDLEATIPDHTTLIEAAVRPSGSAEVPSDPDAGFAKRASGRMFGFKAHVAVDQDSGLVRGAILTAANVNETVVADRLVQGDEKAVYADKAYDTKARRAGLRLRGINDRIMHRPNKHHPVLPPWKARRNRLIAVIRSRVEGTFGLLKRSYRYRHARYLGRVKNQCHLHLLCIALNLRRAVVLTG